mmetsp:Transcript_215/g.386  ORF Transcript_215/g.386 Transcript_215/m.386 type:complete len:109 (+) Transcript_215:522-848(+)
MGVLRPPGGSARPHCRPQARAPTSGYSCRSAPWSGCSGTFVLPYSSKGGARGAMFTEPVNYSFNILLSGYFVAMFVYPPQWLFLSLGIYAVAQNFMPVVIVPARKKVS